METRARVAALSSCFLLEPCRSCKRRCARRASSSRHHGAARPWCAASGGPPATWGASASCCARPSPSATTPSTSPARWCSCCSRTVRRRAGVLPSCCAQAFSGRAKHSTLYQCAAAPLCLCRGPVLHARQARVRHGAGRAQPAAGACSTSRHVHALTHRARPSPRWLHLPHDFAFPLRAQVYSNIFGKGGSMLVRAALQGGVCAL